MKFFNTLLLPREVARSGGGYPANEPQGSRHCTSIRRLSDKFCGAVLGCFLPVLLAGCRVAVLSDLPLAVHHQVFDGPCVDDVACTPWIGPAGARKDRAEFDAGLGLPLLALGSVRSGELRGTDGRVYRRVSCATHLEGPVCVIDLWESIPADGRVYAPDLFSRIYNEKVAYFYSFRK